MFTANSKAKYPPVIAAVLVPPSACITSQSIIIVLSPSFFKSIAARKDLPINLWISMVLPVNLPLEDSRLVLVLVARGNIEYSAVIQPFELPFKNGGTFSSTVALHITLVLPNSIKTEPSGYLIYSLLTLISLISSFFLLFLIFLQSLFDYTTIKFKIQFSLLYQ